MAKSPPLSRRDVLALGAGLVASSALTTACSEGASPSAVQFDIDAPPHVPSIVPASPPPTLVTLNGATVPFTAALLASLPADKRGLVFLQALRQNKDPRSLYGLFDELRKNPSFQQFVNIPFEPSTGIGRPFPDGNAYEAWLAQPVTDRVLVNITRAVDVREVFAKTELFTTAIEELRFTRLDNQVILGMKDTPQYRRELAAMRAAVRPQDLGAIQRIVGKACDAFLDAAGDTVDVVAYARTAPLSYNVEYFGFVDGFGFSSSDISRWGLILNEDVFFNLSDAANIREPADLAAREMKTYLTALIAANRPSDATPITRLLAAQKADSSLDDDAVRRALGAFITGSHLTTTMAISNIVAELFDRGSDVLDGAIAAAARDDDALVAKYCWEAARLRPIGHSLYRVCELPRGQSATLPSGAVVPGGAVLFVPTLSAGLDPEAVPDPYTFRLDRPDDLGFLFCAGRHTCFGVHISKAIIPIAVKQLLKRRPPARGNQGKLGFTAFGTPNGNRFPAESLPIVLRDPAR